MTRGELCTIALRKPSGAGRSRASQERADNEIQRAVEDSLCDSAWFKMIAAAETQRRVQVRPMRTEDIDAILAIDRKISGLQRAVTYDPDRTIGGRFDLSFVAEENRRVAGFLLASESYVPEEVTQACEILTIGVDPDFWEQGVATMLVGRLLAVCRSKGIKMLRVMVDRHDTQLKGFLDHMEFLPGRLIDYYREP